MKFLIAILVVVLMSITIEGVSQIYEKPLNAIYLSYQPIDHGLGIRGDYHFWKAGIYGSASYGRWGLYKHASLKNHIKLTVGILVPLKRYLPNQFDISIGLNHHHVEKIISPDAVYWASGIIYYPWSYEIGLTTKLKRITVGVRTDIMRWEPCIDIGIPIRSRE